MEEKTNEQENQKSDPEEVNSTSEESIAPEKDGEEQEPVK